MRHSFSLLLQVGIGPDSIAFIDLLFDTNRRNNSKHDDSYDTIITVQ